jgi:SAM-dependent methyltransferase
VTVAFHLARSNLLYQHPQWYDEVQVDPSGTAVRTVQTLIADYLPDAATLVEFGCGTARDLHHLATSGLTCTGVDIQPTMIDHARIRHPNLALHVDDMRTARMPGLLGNTDVVLCLGNSLAYLHTDEAIRDAFTTFATHLRQYGLLVLFTLLMPPATEIEKTSRVETPTLRASVTVRYTWSPEERISTLHRRWTLDDGSSATDVIHRRILDANDLYRHLAETGFKHLETFTNPTQRDEPVNAPSAWVAAQYTQ